jgi:hypothetical protein
MPSATAAPWSASSTASHGPPCAITSSSSDISRSNAWAVMVPDGFVLATISGTTSTPG